MVVRRRGGSETRVPQWRKRRPMLPAASSGANGNKYRIGRGDGRRSKGFLCRRDGFRTREQPQSNGPGQGQSKAFYWDDSSVDWARLSLYSNAAMESSSRRRWAKGLFCQIMASFCTLLSNQGAAPRQCFRNTFLSPYIGKLSGPQDDALHIKTLQTLDVAHRRG